MLTIKTPERRHWLPSGIFIVNFEHISHLALIIVPNFNLEQVNADLEKTNVRFFNVEVPIYSFPTWLL